MKRTSLFAIILMFAISDGYSQAVFTKTASNPTSLITNTGSDTLKYTLPGYYDVVTFQPVVTKVSGTVAGSGILRGSLDNVNFVSTGDTITLSNVTKNTAIWIKTQGSTTTPAAPYLYYQFIITGSGTMAATAVMNILARRR